MAKWVYTFGVGRAEGSSAMRDLLGGKGANLAEMANLGLPVPPGFTITTEVCTCFYENQRQFPPRLIADVETALDYIGRLTGKAFGDTETPLLLSVRSGARASMPGMMDTVLNLGLNDITVKALARNAGDERFAYDSYRRFIQMYSSVVLGIGHHHFEDAVEYHKEAKGVALDTELAAEDWEKLIAAFKTKVFEASGKPFPQSPQEQLWGAIAAVFGSWLTPRAITYRRIHGIPATWGTAVNVQAMVFGNMGPTSATGVAFTRNPSTGTKELYGEFLLNAQGEDVVAGIRTPNAITEAGRRAEGSDRTSMETALPDVFAEFVRTTALLERHYRDMQDMEFTVENGKLWMLQTRTGKRTSLAALRIAVDMTNEGLISRDEAIARIDPASLEQLLHPAIDPSAPRNVVATGLPASPGAASGEIAFTADEAEQLKNLGRKVILVRIETSPDDIHGMHAAEGVLTTRGGMTSHAAVVARGMGKPCVTGAAAIRIDYAKGTMSAGDVTFKRGDMLTLDGATGQVIQGAIEMSQPELSGEFAILMKWADEARRMKVRANAESPSDARAAVKFGADGIGLCRTEHMFFDSNRLTAVRQMILADDLAGRRAALEKLLPMQRGDFIELFEIMAGLPVTIRLLDPPLHEFLPKTPAEIDEVAAAVGISAEKIRARLSDLREVNPMLGFRGSRLGIVFPEIAEMQARAIFEAAVEVKRRTGALVRLEIMAPLIIAKPEFDLIKERVDAMASAVAAETGQAIPYTVGTMIETPRASLRAGEIAESAAFLSFGTNDLTQTALALSRDDASSFLGRYVALGILPADPFVSIDKGGVGELVAIGVERSRAARADIKLGICGEHGGDPASIAFCEKLGLDYVSCSPFRVPIARLAAAQAALALKESVTAAEEAELSGDAKIEGFAD
jgi:pyruvate,orthophosphate dikinase